MIDLLYTNDQKIKSFVMNLDKYSTWMIKSMNRVLLKYLKYEYEDIINTALVKLFPPLLSESQLVSLYNFTNKKNENQFETKFYVLNKSRFILKLDLNIKIIFDLNLNLYSTCELNETSEGQDTNYIVIISCVAKIQYMSETLFRKVLHDKRDISFFKMIRVSRDNLLKYDEHNPLII
jgi:hypothetical protein